MVIAMAATAAAAAAEPREADPPPQFTLQSLVTGIDPGTGRDGVTYAITAHVGEQRVRFDLPRPDGSEVSFLVDRDTGEGWAFDAAERTGLPVKVEAVQQLVVDPASPCARMRVVCHRAPRKAIAGVEAEGWRFAGASQRGPGGSHAGVMWIDPATGIVLGYEARTRSRSERRMRSMSVQVEAVAEDLLQPPAALRSR